MAGGIRRDFDEDDELAELGEINVTPFIDVMLVLLIIFMVVAPLSTVDVPVDLPSLTGQNQPPGDKPVHVTLQVDGTLLVEEEIVDEATLGAALQAAAADAMDTRILVRADRAIAYGDVIAVMNRLRDAGFTHLALVGMEAAPASP